MLKPLMANIQAVKTKEISIQSIIYQALRNKMGEKAQIRTSATKQPEVPCFFIFGDSLVDNGNNNGILTLARANYQPYGVDFAQGATGRFCNGRTVVDVLAQLLGFTDYIPPFSSATGDSLIKGVNFASGASGLGSNDYLNNYFMPNYYSTPNQYTPAAYATALLQEYSRQLTDLYRLGARKVIIPGIGPIGCIPYELARFNGTAQSRCNEDKNNVVNLFNSGLRQLVDTINNGQFPGAKFVYLDSFKGSKELTANKKSYGLEVTEEGCCGVGKNNGQITCLPLQTPCENRSKYLFWDAFHPTEVANVIYAKMAYNSKANAYAHPINVRQLATL
uniref:GDSL esterase/lipase n=1 Tax=Chenopodium quinoa TaxID=63459 RepID=A0A803M2D3_CHEQI